MMKQNKFWQRITSWTARTNALAIGRDYGLILIGTTLMAVSLHLFYIPNQLATGGLTGYAQLINRFTGWPIGVMVFVANIPLFVVGWRYLGGRRFLARTIFGSAAFSVILDTLSLVLPEGGLTHDFMLNALYGGLVMGVGTGLVLRSQATTGGTDILARFLGKRYGVPLSRSYLYTDGLVVFLAAILFSWEHALYAILALYVTGRVTEVVASGVNVERMALIVTNVPEKVAQQVLQELGRGITEWRGKGMYTGRERPILMCVVSQSEVVQLKTIIHESDPDAFVIVGLASEVLGEGFRPLREA
ncbi:MAG: YitT family protein [Ardenticatenaceae bacterium]|nr:YitT family protein [Ardenticatenaceae bacterium]